MICRVSVAISVVVSSASETASWNPKPPPERYAASNPSDSISRPGQRVKADRRKRRLPRADPFSELMSSGHARMLVASLNGAHG